MIIIHENDIDPENVGLRQQETHKFGLYANINIIYLGRDTTYQVLSTYFHK